MNIAPIKFPVFLRGIIPCMLFSMIIFQGCHSASKEVGSDEIPSLKEAYRNHFLVGVALSARALDDSVSPAMAIKHFNSITAENAMKWEKIHPGPGEYDFENSDKFVAFGEANDMYIIGHVLIWHSQTPYWVFQNEDGSRTSRDTLLKRMEDHIKTVVGRYKGRVQCWDVVNEAVDDAGNFRQNIWAEIIGKDYVQKAFEYAREADPEAVLIYNDYSLPTKVKREGVVKLISEIQANGVKVDGIGMQAHYHFDYPLLDELEESIIAFSKLGCKVHITEMDINILPRPDNNVGAAINLNFEYDEKWNPWPDSLPDSMQLALAARYVELFDVYNRNADKIDRVTLWGIDDGGSWLNYWPIFGRSNYPLLFDRKYQPKEAFWALINMVKE